MVIKYHFERRQPKDDSGKFWLKLDKWFQMAISDKMFTKIMLPMLNLLLTIASMNKMNCELMFTYDTPHTNVYVQCV